MIWINNIPSIAWLLIAYYVVEFTDYIIGIISYIAQGDYSSHKARIGAKNKLCYCVATALLIIVIQVSKVALKKYGYDVNGIGSLLSFTWLAKMIITEISSIYENYKRLTGGKE